MSSVSLFLLVCILVGNTAVLSYSLNWWYGNPLPHGLLSGVRYLHGLLVVGVPAGLAYAQAGDLTGLFVPESGAWGRTLAAGYVLLCGFVTVVWLPVITVRRLLHRPAVLVHNHTRTLDVAARLGYKPIGRGKYRLLARLPGNDIFRVDFAERSLCLPQLPAEWDGLTILHLTDLHLCGTPDREFYREVMEGCREWDPDILALTGDVVDSEKHHRWILPLLGRLRWRVAALAVLGNHDTWYEPGLVRRRLRRLGIEVLGNRWTTLRVRGRPMVAVGNESPWLGPVPDMTGCPDGVFRLCLSHSPDTIAWARRNRIDLMLAGHVHGGQIRVPGFGSILVPSLYSRRYDCGVFEEGPTVLHVSRGLAGQHPLRYNCRPEVTRITLQRVGANPAS